MDDRSARLLKVHNRHGWFIGDADKVEVVLKAFHDAGALRQANEDIYLMHSYLNEAAYPVKYDDVKNRVELAIMIADITPHIDTVEQYMKLANREVLRG